MGLGALTADCESFEGQVSTHGQPLTAAGGCIIKTLEGLGGSNDEPFVIFPEVKELYKKREDELRQIVAERKENLHHTFFYCTVEAKNNDGSYKFLIRDPDEKGIKISDYEMENYVNKHIIRDEGIEKWSLFITPFAN